MSVNFYIWIQKYIGRTRLKYKNWMKWKESITAYQTVATITINICEKSGSISYIYIQ